MDPDSIVQIFIAFSAFIGAPAVIFTFIHQGRKLKLKTEEWKYKKEILELEVRKEELHIDAIREESRKLDRAIESSIKALE